MAPGARLAAWLVCAASAPKSLLKTLPRCLAHPKLALAWRRGVPQAPALPRHAWGSAAALRALGSQPLWGPHCGVPLFAAGCCAPPPQLPGSFGHAPARRAAPRCRCPRPRRQGSPQSYPVIIGIRSCGARARGSARQARGEAARKLRCLLVAAVLAEALQPSVQGSSPPDNGATVASAQSVAFGAAAGHATYVL